MSQALAVPVQLVPFQLQPMVVQPEALVLLLQSVGVPEQSFVFGVQPDAAAQSAAFSVSHADAVP